MVSYRLDCSDAAWDDVTGLVATDREWLEDVGPGQDGQHIVT